MRPFEIILAPDQVYHIYNRANGNEKLFLEPKHYETFLYKYKQYIDPIAETLAYCLIPNHFHLMVKLKAADFSDFSHFSEVMDFREVREVSKGYSHVFGNFFSSYTQWFNLKTDRKGALFMPNFKRKIVEDSAYFAQLVAYIHTNPIKHGLTHDLYQWPYSSFHSYASYKKTELEPNLLLEFFGGKEDLIDFHENFSQRVQEMHGLDID